MSTILEQPNVPAVPISDEEVRQFLYREARFLDDKEWEKWLALYDSQTAAERARLGLLRQTGTLLAALQ